MLDEAAAGCAEPRHRRPRRPESRLDDDEIRERMSGNLCRCGAYRSIVAADPRRSARPREALRLRARRRRRRAPSPRSRPSRRAAFLAGGTNLVDLMKLGVADPGPARRRHPPAAGRRSRTARRRPADRRGRPQQRPRRRPAGPRSRYPVLVAGAARRRLGAAAQHGHHRRQPAAAHPLRLLPRRHHAVQQARAGLGLLGARRATPATTRSSAPPSTASPPTRRTWRSRCGPRRRRRGARARRRARASPLAELHRLPGDAPRRATRPSPHGELITAVDLPPLPIAARSAYRKVRDRASYAFALVSVAAAVERRRTASSRDVRLALGGVAHAPWRATGAEEALRGGPADGGRVRAPRPRPSSRPPRPRRDNAFKVPMARGAIVATLRRPDRDRRGRA